MDTERRPVPSFIGIGAKKCATTWISECLRHHPDVFVSSPKELHFFSAPKRWARGKEWYLDHFQHSQSYQAAGEFSPSYLAIPESAERIRSVLGEVKIIASVRSPTQRFISDYKQLIRKASLSSEFRELNLERFDWATRRKPRLLINGMYYDNLLAFIDVFGRENVCIVLKEDIDRDPNDVLRTVYGFVGVDQSFVPPIAEKITSPSIVPRFGWLEDIRRRTYRRLERVDPRLVVLIRRLRLAELYRSLNRDRRETSFKVDAEVIEALDDYYKDDITNMEGLLGRSLDEWRQQGA